MRKPLKTQTIFLILLLLTPLLLHPVQLPLFVTNLWQDTAMMSSGWLYLTNARKVKSDLCSFKSLYRESKNPKQICLCEWNLCEFVEYPGKKETLEMMRCRDVAFYYDQYFLAFYKAVLSSWKIIRVLYLNEFVVYLHWPMLQDRWLCFVELINDAGRCNLEIRLSCKLMYFLLINLFAMANTMLRFLSGFRVQSRFYDTFEK